MDQDEKMQRPPRAVVVRSTAPAGTPYPVAPNSPAPAPVPTESQPRTVGGHTARLMIAEEESLEFDSFDGPEPGVQDAGSMEPGPSAAVGGTVRLATVSPDAAATAKSDVARQEAEQSPPGKEPSKPDPEAGPKKAPPALALAVSEAAAGGGGSDTLALLFAPVSVAVGLVFFAMGSMLTLTVEGRLIRLSVSLPADAAGAATSVPQPPGPAGGATHPAAVAASAAAALPSSSAVVPGHVSRPPDPPGSAVKPPVPQVTGRPQGSGKLKPIIF